MIDITRETAIALADVASLLKVSIVTVRRWASRVGSQRLETVKFGGKVVTSLEALQRFGQQHDDSEELVVAGVPAGSQASDERRQLKARHGI